MVTALTAARITSLLLADGFPFKASRAWRPAARALGVSISLKGQFDFPPEWRRPWRVLQCEQLAEPAPSPPSGLGTIFLRPPPFFSNRGVP